jgi:hypothetical protein
VDRPESRLSPSKIGVWPPDMKDRTSGRFGFGSRVHEPPGFSLSGLTGCGQHDRSSWVPSIVGFGSAGDDPAPPTGYRTFERSDFPLPRRVSHSRILSLPISRSLSLTLSISPPFSLSRLSISRISLLSLTLSLAVSVFGQQNREETKKEERRIEEKEEKRRSVVRL